MSKITSIYNNLVSLCEGALPDHKRIPNPYALEQNSELILEQGWGLVVSTGENTNRQIGCDKSYSRSFQIIITRKITTTDHNIDQRTAIEKQILEDLHLVWSALENDSDLTGQTAQTIQVLDGGLEFFEGDRAKYLGVIIDVFAEYFEQL